nr:activator of HSP90 ATPase 1 family protein [Saprospiraceae bacterium]
MKREKFDMEFLFKASPAILYKFFTAPSCLVRWFCDGVDIQEDTYTFSWEGYEEVAELVDDIEEERLRFRWLDAESEDEYFEYRLSSSAVTGETILEITDFADEGEVDDQKQLWSNQISQLKKETGG